MSNRFVEMGLRSPVNLTWEMTQECNLKCRHCLSSSGHPAPDELTTAEALSLVDQIHAAGVFQVNIGGGEPFMRPDFEEILAACHERRIMTCISTNGTLLDAALAQRLQRSGLTYAGISLDGAPATHDAFRRRAGAYAAALAGLRACRDAGLKVGLRFTICRANAHEAVSMFDLMQAERIPRICFYHLAYTGRGAALAADDLTHAETRALVA